MEYDYIIVGGGSGGASLAGRLASNCPDATIALIEAGPHTARSLLVNMPLGIAALVPLRTKYNYGYETEPQPGLAGRYGYQPRGRGFGGSSAINAMIYTRGHPLDYDEWAQMGCTGWSWNDVLPYFLRSEDNARGANAWHGAGGPLSVSDLRDPNPVAGRFIRAAVEAGFRANDQQIIRGGKSASFIETVGSSESAQYVLSVKFPLAEESGDSVAAGGICLDITEQLRLQKELRRLNEDLESRITERTADLSAALQSLQESELRLSKTTANAPCMIFQFVLRPDGNDRVISISGSAKQVRRIVHGAGAHQHIQAAARRNSNSLRQEWNVAELRRIIDRQQHAAGFLPGPMIGFDGIR